MPKTKTAYRTCHLCEAACGLEITVSGSQVLSVRGDALDVESAGYLCPKGASIGAIDADPDRLTRPMVRRDGELVEVTWDEAFDEVRKLVRATIDDHGHDAVATYVGNPTAHNHAYGYYLGEFAAALGTKQMYSASTMDAMPQQLAAALMFGHSMAMPLPDLGRTQFLLIIGGNPAISHGALGHSPDYVGKIKAIKERGGRVVVIDPIRTRTAVLAQEHVAVRPGTDAHLVASMLHVIMEEGHATLGPLKGQIAGLQQLRDHLAGLSPERTARRTGVSPDVVRCLARDFAAADPAAAFGRLGTTLSQTGTLTNALINALNIVTGNLDQPGGVLFATPATGSPLLRKPRAPVDPEWGRFHSRVSGRPEVLGEMSVACLAEEITTPGKGRLRALIAFAGNIARSLPNSPAIEAALDQLDAFICVDPYLNQTTRHAHVVLPPPPNLSRSHYDLFLYSTGTTNVANYSDAVVTVPDGMLEEWQILLRLAQSVAEEGSPAAATPPDVADEQLFRRNATKAARILGIEPEKVVAATTGTGPDRLLDIKLRIGPYGDGYDPASLGLSLAALRAAPHGIDLGPFVPNLDTVLRTASGLIELVPNELEGDFEKLALTVDDVLKDGQLLMVGRRHLRSKNSWLHNVPQLVRGADRSSLWVHPQDADRLGITDGSTVEVSSRVGSVSAVARITDEVMQGVCSLPHGWGNGGHGTRTAVASAHPGTNANALTDETRLDVVSGTIAANGVPVRLAPCSGRSAADESQLVVSQ